MSNLDYNEQQELGGCKKTERAEGGMERKMPRVSIHTLQAEHVRHIKVECGEPLENAKINQRVLHIVHDTKEYDDLVERNNLFRHRAQTPVDTHPHGYVGGPYTSDGNYTPSQEEHA